MESMHTEQQFTAIFFFHEKQVKIYTIYYTKNSTYTQALEY